MTGLGKYLLLTGALLFIAGVVVLLFGKTNFPLGRLPGDLVWRGKNSTFYFPLVTCILISVVLSAISLLISKLRR